MQFLVLFTTILMAVLLVDSTGACNGLHSETVSRSSRNKKLIEDFFHKVFGDKEIEFVDQVICEDEYIQHNPNLPDGRQALKDALSSRPNWQMKIKDEIDIRLINAEDDMVWLQRRIVNNLTGIVTAAIDIYKFRPSKTPNEDGKEERECAFEHWDLFQDVPTNSANSHPMFS